MGIVVELIMCLVYSHSTETVELICRLFGAYRFVDAYYDLVGVQIPDLVTIRSLAFSLLGRYS